jgi:hypothetical protein
MITNDVSDYINLFVGIAHIICNHPLHAYTIFVGDPEGKTSLGRRKHRWKDNIKTDLKETVYKDVWCSSGQGSAVGSCEYDIESSGFIKGGQFLGELNDSYQLLQLIGSSVWLKKFHLS